MAKVRSSVNQCPRCKLENNFKLEIMPDDFPHYAKATCQNCGCVWWPPKPKNERTVTRGNDAVFLKMWRDKLGGKLVCYMCGVKEGVTHMQFQCDHLFGIEDGGDDEFDNTRPICSSCHLIKNSLRFKTREYDKLLPVDPDNPVPF